MNRYFVRWFLLLINAEFTGKKVNMMPLSMAGNGETVAIKKISGNDEVRQHLSELGFVVNEEVTVVNQVGGNLILRVKDSRIALDKSMANRILV